MKTPIFTENGENRPSSQINYLAIRAFWVITALALLMSCNSSIAQAAPLVKGLGGAADLGTLAMTPNDDGSTGRIYLGAGFPNGINFFGKTYTYFHINNNGNITFNGALSSYTPRSFPISNQPMIAPYWADVDTRGVLSDSSKNKVYYSIVENKLFVTWYYVGYYASRTDKLNAFQLILTSRDDVDTGDFDVEFRYEQLQWTTGNASGGSGGLGGTPAQMGFDAGDKTHFFKHPDSLTANIIKLAGTSNVYDPGVWQYEVRNGNVNPVEVPVLTNIRVLCTLPGNDIQIDETSFTRAPYSVTTSPDGTVIEWRYDTFPANITRDLSFAVDMKNPAGGEQRQLSKKVELFYNDVNGIPVRTELGPQYIQVLDTVFDRSISMDKPAYQANEEAEISVNIQNLSGYALNIDAKVVVEDREGALLKEIATMQLLNFAAGETKSFGPLFFNTGSIYAGDYRALLLLYEGSKQIGTASADFEILPDIAVSTNIVTDKIFYMPNEQATLTGTVTNQSLNYVMGNLTAKIAITQGPEETVQFYAGTKEIPILLQGGASTFKTIWNTGTNPAGTYIVTLEVLDAAGVVLSDSTRELTIASTTEPSALLKGEMSLDKQSVLSGEPVTVSYSLSNAGNVDLSDVSLSVQTVSMTDETVCDSINDQATLAMGATYTNSGQIDTQGYSAKDYLVVLQANIAGVTETLAGTYFRVNDSTPPELSVDSPVEGEVYRDEVLFTVHAIDTESGINRVEYRLDEQESWNILTLSDSSDDTYLARWETTFEDDGQHILAVRGFDKAGNQAGPATVAFNILNDFTPPETRLEIGEPYFEAPDGPVYVTVDTPFTLAATDDLSGVQATYYRFNEEQDWRVYYGAFQLADLGFGPHTLHFRTVDISGNQEDEKSDQVTLIGVEMETEILNPPRVLVWAGEPAKKVNYTLADIRTLVEEVLATPDAYFKLTTDKAEFQTEFRSGLYNMVFILDRDISLNAPFLREILDAVSGGKGLLVSGGNNVHPFLQETLGVDFRGSLPMADGEHALYLYPGVLSDGQTLLVKGRVLKTKLDGGDLAGIVLGEKTCSGLRKVTLHYPVALAAGDVITVTLYQEENGELRPLDEERYTIDSLPAAPACAVSGNPSGDVSIGTIASDGATASVSAPFGQLGDHYLLSVRVDRPDGSSITGDVSFRSTCSANLQSGVLIGPFRVQSVEEDNLTGREDVPAIVLGRYGRGRTAFISYNIVESALQGHRQEQSDLLGRAAAYLLPETELNVMQVANRIKVHGAGLNLTAIDSLGKGLLYLPIFGLENKSLEYRFHLADDEEYTYRYFIKGSEDAEYSISTGLYLELGDETLLFDRHTFSLSPP